MRGAARYRGRGAGLPQQRRGGRRTREEDHRYDPGADAAACAADPGFPAPNLGAALHAVAQHVVAVAGGALTEADPAALAEHRFATTQAQLTLGAVGHQERSIGRLVGEEERAVAAEDARVQARG